MHLAVPHDRSIASCNMEKPAHGSGDMALALACQRSALHAAQLSDAQKCEVVAAYQETTRHVAALEGEVERLQAQLAQVRRNAARTSVPAAGVCLGNVCCLLGQVSECSCAHLLATARFHATSHSRH